MTPKRRKSPLIGRGNPRLQVRQVGHHHLGGFGRCRCALIGDVVGQGAVRFVPDGAHHRRGRVGHRAAHDLAVERHEVLEGPTAARQDDDVDLRLGIQISQRRRDLRRRPFALYQGSHDHEMSTVKSPLNVADHVGTRGAVAGRDEADPARQKRQRTFAGVRREPFRLEPCAKLRDSCQQKPVARRLQPFDAHTYRAPSPPELDATVRLHQLPLAGWGRQFVEHVRLHLAVDLRRIGVVGVHQREVHLASTRPAKVRDLTLKPE